MTPTLQKANFEQTSPVSSIDESELDGQTPLKFLLLRLYEAFRNRLFEFAFEEPLESVSDDDLRSFTNQAFIGKALIFTFLSFLHQS